MSTNWLGPVAVMVIVPIVMGVLGKKNSAELPERDGSTELRLPRFYKVLGWICLVMPMGFLYGGTAVWLNEGFGKAWLILLAGVAFAYLCWKLISDGGNHRASYNAEVLQITDGRGKVQECAWSEITEGKVHPISKMIKLRTMDGRMMELSAMLIGSDGLFNMMAEKTNLDVQTLVKKARP